MIRTHIYVNQFWKEILSVISLRYKNNWNGRLTECNWKNIWWTSTFLWRSPPHSIEVPPRLQRKEFDKVFVNKAVNRMREFSSWASDEAALQKGTHWHDEPAQSIQAPDFICRKPGKVANELLAKMENTKKEAGEIKQLILSIFGN